MREVGVFTIAFLVLALAGAAQDGAILPSADKSRILQVSP